MKINLLIITITSLAGFALAADSDSNKKGAGNKGQNPAERAEMMLKHADKDGNGSISKAEFSGSKIAQKITEKKGADAVGKMFDRIDKNNDGELSKGELTSMGPGKGKKPSQKKSAS